MKRHPSHPPSRLDTWRNSAFYALAVSAVLLVVIKFATGVMFATAFIVAILLFGVIFAFLMRLTPRNDG